MQIVIDIPEIQWDWLHNHFPDENDGMHAINAILKGTPLSKGHWVYKIYGGFHEQGNWYCSHCDYQYNYGNGHAKFCPKCGCKMSEPSTEEVIGDRDYDWIIKR